MSPTPILMLHGHPGSGACMDVFAQAFADPLVRGSGDSPAPRRCLAPDLRGYGRHRASRPFEMSDHLDDLAQIIERDLSGSCLLLGWSLGGILAMELALRYPDRIAGIILIATSAQPWGDHPRTGWKDDLLTGIAGILNAIKPGWQWNIETFGKRSLFHYLVQQHTPETYRYLARYALPAYLQTSRHANSALNRALRNRYNRLADLGQIQCPVLMLVGACDRHIAPASSLKTAAHLPNIQTQIYDQVAHLFPWEIPDQVNADIGNWLKKHNL
jgi:pimeloyl-ACP methyl ester carboxylesterase